MTEITFPINGTAFPLVFTAEALFRIYDKFGTSSDLLESTGLLEPTLEGWKNACWIGALLLSQGELRRRQLGYDPRPMLSDEYLRTNLLPSDAPAFRQAIVDAMNQGFERCVEAQTTDQEIDLVLLEREEAEKKQKARELSELATSVLALIGSILESVTPFS